mgnify:CR=1 FL=1
MKVCQRCIVQFGFKLADKNKTFETDEELFEHLEMIHGIPVRREGETEKDCMKRTAKKGLSSDRNKCVCEECKIYRGEKTSLRISDLEIAKKYIDLIN